MKKSVENLIQSIIKEYVNEPIVPKQRTLPHTSSDENEKEVQDKYFRVSKMEESEALNFIRNQFMDYAIKLFKIQYSHHLSRELSIDIVNKRLKKISDDRFNGQRKKDVIQYFAPLSNNYNLTINVFKNQDGVLAIGYINPIHCSVKCFLVHGPEKLTPMYEMDAPKPLMEMEMGPNGIPKYTPEELYQKFNTISKKEADQVFNYIKRNIVPPAVNKYNKWVVDLDRVTVEQVNANLKKVCQEARPIRLKSKVNYDIIIWRADIKVSHDAISSFIFCTFKQFAGKLFVGVHSPVTVHLEIYSALTNPPFETELGFCIDPEALKENVETQWHITKSEEHRALQFLRNFILPKVIEEYSEVAGEREVPVIHHGPEEREIINSLRKVRHTKFPEHKTDQVLYIAEFKGWQWVFIIEKVGMGVRIPFIRAGYIDDRWNESKMYNINIPRPDHPSKPWQDPRMACQRIRDYMPYQPGGTPGLLGLKKKKLSEAFGSHDLTMSKKEEDFGFHLLKQKFYDERIRKTLRKINHIRSTAPNHVPDKVIYEFNYPNHTVAWYALEKNCRTGKLVYYPVDEKGKRTTSRNYPLEGDEDLNETLKPNNFLHISKEEEGWALQQLRKRKNNQGKPIGKFLKKIEHTVSDNPRRSDRIKYKNTDDATTYTIVKDRIDGKLGYHAGFIMGHGKDDYESVHIDDFEVPLHEARKRPIKIYQTTPYATPKIQRAFARVHNQQRWEGPESMFNNRANPGVQFGTGVWLDSLEHSGDLVHRASYAGTSEDFGGGGNQFGRGAVLEKAERLLRRYTSAYGFARDVSEQIGHNYLYYSSEGDFKGTEEEFRAIVKAAGERYAQAYEKIQPITIVQKLGRDIAIDTGRFQFDKAVPKLKALIRVLNSPDWEKFYWAPLKGTLLKEYVTPPWPKAVLTKKDEARAVQFIKMLTDKHIKTLFSNEKIEKEIKKQKVIPSENPDVISDKSVYLVTLSGGQPHRTHTFEIFFSNRLGLVVNDPINFAKFYVDVEWSQLKENTEPDPYGILFKRGLREGKHDLDPKLIITKKEEAQAFAWLSNLTEKGKRFGKSIKKTFDDEENGRHVIKYLVDAGGSVGVFSVSKNQIGWIIILSNFGSVIHVIKHP